MRVLRSIVQPFVLTVLDAWHDLSLRRAVTLQLVRDDDTWYVLQAFQQLAEELLRRFLISLTLYQNIQDVAILVHGSPQVMILAIDLNEHLIQVSLVTGSRTTTAQFISVCLTELERPFTDRFVSYDHPTNGHDLFNVAKAQSEAEVEPHSVADDFSREAMAAV